ncbi:MAG: ATP-grasp domain-containing protein [Chloroflexi bacterium]|nr:ATP-grasp domain-containing protein [Chloroflexota bacterium]
MPTKRLILLLSAQSYRAQPFLDAAKRLGVEVVKGVDAPAPLPGFVRGPLPLDFRDPAKSTRAIVAFAEENPVQAILAIDDSATVLAAQASAALGLPHNSPEAAMAARSKYRMRQLLTAAGVPSPDFRYCCTDDDPEYIAEEIDYPCVVKPLYLSGSRGVIRADHPAEFVAAFERLKRILIPTGSTEILVERFIPGFEVALEGILNRGALKILALFDKPDPLHGPFFEETIYVTPSRRPEETQSEIRDCAARAAAALGLREGPIHAELRVNEAGPWIVEIAGRSIGGLCSNTLRFGTDVSEEELILRQAFGMEIESFSREDRAGGVMMIPIPSAGILKCVEGVTDAEIVPGIESIEITAKLNYPIVPLPEGDSYLGFIFARGASPAEVEAALREAHRRLRFEIVPEISVLANC